MAEIMPAMRVLFATLLGGMIGPILGLWVATMLNQNCAETFAPHCTRVSSGVGLWLGAMGGIIAGAILGALWELAGRT